MELELNINDLARIAAPNRENAFKAATIITRYVVEAILFGFLAGAIGYGIQIGTEWDAVLSYGIGMGFVACVYFVYLTRIMGMDRAR